MSSEGYQNKDLNSQQLLIDEALLDKLIAEVLKLRRADEEPSGDPSEEAKSVIMSVSKVSVKHCTQWARVRRGDDVFSELNGVELDELINEVQKEIDENQGKATQTVERGNSTGMNSIPKAEESANMATQATKRRKNDPKRTTKIPENTSFASGATNSASEDTFATPSKAVKSTGNANYKSLNNPSVAKPTEEKPAVRRSGRTPKPTKRFSEGKD